MTGIKRLRALAGAWDEWGLGGALAEIADEIERERDAEVADSPYDAILPEDRDAVAWVREHGGLDAVERRWECLSYYADPVPRSCMEKRLARLQRQIDESHAALRRRRVRIEELGKTTEFFQLNNSNFRHLLADVAERLGFTRYGDDYEPEDLLDALDRRLVPEGMEWPRYESGELVQIGEEVDARTGGSFAVGSVTLRDDSFALNASWYERGERVKRPAPKVYDADGVEIREGDRVWSTHLDEPHEWIVIDPHEDRGDSQTVLVSIGDRTGHARPEDLTHRAPVLAADGEPLEVGQTVYVIASGKTHHVTEIDTVSKRFRSMEQVDGSHWLDPMCFTHTRPVLDADGVPIHEGDHGWWLERPGVEIIVKHIDRGECLQLTVYDVHGRGNTISAGEFTHTKPEPPKRLCRDCRHWQGDPSASHMGVCFNSYMERCCVDSYAAQLDYAEACEDFEERGE